MFVKFKYQVFYNEVTGYSVNQYKSSDLGKTITCVGYNLPTTKNITYEFDAKLQTNTKYKDSYFVNSWQEHINQTQDDIVAYLSSGLFSGLSKKNAQKIYDTFGANTLEIMDQDIERLNEVAGIGAKTLAKIKSDYMEKRASRLVAEKLIKYGISVNQCNKICKFFKEDALSIIENAPYSLCKVKGITFPVVDAIAKDMQFSDTNYERIKAAALYVLEQDMVSGNVCMEKNDFGLKLIQTLNTPKISKVNVLGFVLKMMKDGTICYNKRNTISGKEEYFYHPSAYKAERNIAVKIRVLLSKKKRIVFNLESIIEKYEKQLGITLDETQKEAVKLGVTEPIFVITGGPGTGKTTILQMIAKINQELNNGNDNIVFLSPTGRAARRISEQTGYVASTIHSMLKLGVNDEEDAFYSEEEPTIEDALVICDESSMVDMWVMELLVSSLKNSSLGMVGDINQLPSVRCGSILRDMIASEIIPCVCLETIHRQSDDAINIMHNAKNIKNGIKHLNESTDFEIKEVSHLNDAEDEMIKQAIKLIAEYGEENVRILCPFLKNNAGVYRMNMLMQQKLNPNKTGLSLKIPNEMEIREGDPVMQLVNKEMSNGDIGYIIRITSDTVTVRFCDLEKTIVEYTYQDAKEQLTLAYAMTVHKAQGGEYKAIVLVMTMQHSIMLRRNLLYTGLTRSRHKCVVVGSKDALFKAIDNNMIEDRHSMLAELINPSLVKTVPEMVAPKDTYEQMKLPFVDL